MVATVLLTCAMLFAAPPTQGGDNDIVEKVTTAVSRGDVPELVEHAAERVEIAVLGNITVYSRAQATYVLEDFFRAHPPARFVANAPTVAEGSIFVAGRYWYGEDKKRLDIYLRLRRHNDAFLIREIRIERPAR